MPAARLQLTEPWAEHQRVKASRPACGFASGKLAFSVEALEDRRLLAAIELSAAGFVGGERMGLQVDGVTIQTWTVEDGAASGDFQTYAFSSNLVVTPDRVRVAFLNDAIVGGNDRNLRVESIKVDGVEFRTDDPTVFSNGTYVGDTLEDGFGRGDTLHVNGYFEYAGPNAGSRISVRAAGDEGDELFALLVNQATVGTFHVPTAPGQVHDFHYRAVGDVEAHQVQVAFLNDLFDLPRDRNLFVDHIVIDGTVFETEATTVYSDGVFANGLITAGFGQGETLHSNGVFAYGGLTRERQRYQAESAQLNGVIVENVHPGFDGTGAVGFINDVGDAVSFTVDVGHTGDYQVDLRYAAGPASVGFDRSLSVYVNGAKALVSDYRLTHSFNAWAVQSETLRLNAGANTITYQIDDDDTGFINIDYIETTPLLVIQAEDGQIDSASLRTATPRFEGTGYIGSIQTGGSVSFETVVAEAGVYYINTRYAAGPGGPDRNRTLSVRVNGVSQGQANFVSTTEWTDWSHHLHRVELDAGVNNVTFQFGANDSGWVDLDAFTVSSAISVNNRVADPVRSNLALNIVQSASLPVGGAQMGVEHAGDGSGRLFGHVQGGQVYVINPSGLVEPTPFLDLTTAPATQAKFVVGSGAFRGLTYIAFHPDYGNPGTLGFGKFYTAHRETPNGTPDYSMADLQNPPATGAVGHYVIAEWNVSSNNPNRIDAASYRVVLRLEYLFSPVHGIGEIAFNPFAQPGDADYGLMYAAIGDASNGTTVPLAPSAQQRDNPFGKLLRINPLPSGAANYSVPSSNPFAGGPVPEIYAYGFRDPQNFGWGQTSDGQIRMFITDIGFDSFEEINIVSAGGNYGWDAWEAGFHVSTTPVDGGGELIFPVAVYDHLLPSNQISAVPAPTDAFTAVVGGFVYRGSAAPELRGQYIFGDIPRGRFWTLNFDEMVDAFEAGSTLQIEELLVYVNGVETLFPALNSSTRGDARFGVDENGEMYVTSKANERIYRIVGSQPELVAELPEVTSVGRSLRIQLSGTTHKILVDLENRTITTANGSTTFDQRVKRIVARDFDQSGELYVVGTRNTDRVTARRGYLRVNTRGTVFIGRDFEEILIEGNGGDDTANLRGSRGVEQMVASPRNARLSGHDYSYTVDGFSSIVARMRGGNDQAHFVGSFGDDDLRVRKTSIALTGSGFQMTGIGFGQISVSGRGGDDTAVWDNRPRGSELIHRHGFILLAGLRSSYQLQGVWRVFRTHDEPLL